MPAILLIVAVVIAVAGVVRVLSGDVALGILLLVLACAVGPGGWSIFH